MVKQDFGGTLALYCYFIICQNCLLNLFLLFCKLICLSSNFFPLQMMFILLWLFNSHGSITTFSNNIIIIFTFINLNHLMYIFTAYLCTKAFTIVLSLGTMVWPYGNCILMFLSSECNVQWFTWILGLLCHCPLMSQAPTLTAQPSKHAGAAPSGSGTPSISKWPTLI